MKQEKERWRQHSWMYTWLATFVPTASGEVDETRLPSINDLEPGGSATVVRMSDRDPAFLRYLDGMGIRPGAKVHVTAREPFSGPIMLEVEGEAQAHAVGTNVASQVYIQEC